MLDLEFEFRERQLAGLEVQNTIMRQPFLMLFLRRFEHAFTNNIKKYNNNNNNNNDNNGRLARLTWDSPKR